jgi:hypothetical protein
MAAWRTLGSVVVALAAVQYGYAQPYPLTETPKAGDCFRIRLDLKLSGEKRVARDGKLTPVPLKAAASHEFPERVLSVDAAGLPTKTARFYELATATITDGADVTELKLRPERCLLVAQRPKDELLVYSPTGPLTPAEWELTGQHFDTLHVVGLLPGKGVAVGESWKVSNRVAQALCAFEGLTAQDLACKLEGVQDQVATVSFAGTASGIDTGAAVKLTVSGSYRFDLNRKRLVRLEWKQKDEREQGPASPASVLEATYTLTRTPIEQPNTLSDVALVPVPDGNEVPAPLTQFVFREPRGRFELVHGREWQLVGRTDDQFVLRLMERGDFVAQVTITWWTKAEAGKHLTPEEFRQAMDGTPGWQPEEEIQTGEVPAAGGNWCYRLSLGGKLDGLKVTQNFFLLASPSGEQVVLAFTMTPGQVARLGSRDRVLVDGLSFGVKK